MARYGAVEKQRIAALRLPDGEATLAAVRDYMGRAGLGRKRIRRADQLLDGCVIEISERQIRIGRRALARGRVGLHAALPDRTNGSQARAFFIPPRT